MSFFVNLGKPYKGLIYVKKVLPLLIGATVMALLYGMFSAGALVAIWVICIVIAVANSSTKKVEDE